MITHNCTLHPIYMHIYKDLMWQSQHWNQQVSHLKTIAKAGNELIVYNFHNIYRRKQSTCGRVHMPLAQNAHEDWSRSQSAQLGETHFLKCNINNKKTGESVLQGQPQLHRSLRLNPESLFTNTDLIEHAQPSPTPTRVCVVVFKTLELDCEFNFLFLKCWTDSVI